MGDSFLNIQSANMDRGMVRDRADGEGERGNKGTKGRKGRGGGRINTSSNCNKTCNRRACKRNVDQTPGQQEYREVVPTVAMVGLVSMMARAHIMSEMTLSKMPLTTMRPSTLKVMVDKSSYPV